MEETQTQRLATLIKGRGWSQRYFAKLINTSPQAITGWWNRGTIPSSKLTVVARVLGVSVEYLLTGKDAPIALSDSDYRRHYPEAPEFVEVPIINGDDLPGSAEREEIPAYKIRVSAGAGSHAYTEEPNGSLGFRRGWLHAKGLNSKDLVIVQVDGDSMAPYIQHSDIVLVDTSKNTIRSGDIYVFRVDHDLRCKRLFKNLDGSILVHSDNEADPRYKDETLSPADLESIAILGAVIWRGGS